MFEAYEIFFNKVKAIVELTDSNLQLEMEQVAAHYQEEQNKENNSNIIDLKPQKEKDWGNIQAAIMVTQVQITTCLKLIADTKSPEGEKIAAIKSCLSIVENLVLEAQAKLGK